MSGYVNLMTINDQISFWHCFKINANNIVTYEQIYLHYLNKLQAYLQKNYPNATPNLSKIFQQIPQIFIYQKDDISKKKPIANLKSKVVLNSDLLVNIDQIEFESTDQTPKIILPKQNLPSLTANESIEIIQKANKVETISPRSALKFLKSSSSYDLYEYVKLLYKQKKFELILPIIDELKIRYPRNSNINLIIAKCYEAFHQNDKSIQIYKETLLFSDTPSILIECSKLYMNTDKYLSSLLLNHTLFLDSTNSNVIIQSMLEFFSHKQYNEALDIAFRTKKSIKFLARSFKHNEELSLHFSEFIKSSQIPLSVFSIEGTDLASLFYKNGAVVESLFLCNRIFKMVQAAAQANKSYSDPYQSVDDDKISEQTAVKQHSTEDEDLTSIRNYPYAARVYFTILLNEGHYKRFSEMSQEFVTIMSSLDDEEVNEIYGIQRFFRDYMSIVACKERIKPITAFIQQFDLLQATERQKIIIDCICLLSNFLFLIGSCNEISSFPNLGLINFKIDSKRPYWQARLMYKLIQPVSDILVMLDTSKPSASIIGDENVVLAGYQQIFASKPTGIENDFEKVHYYLIPSPIIGLSIWKLRKDNKSGQKESFWSRIEAADESPFIIIELGSVDCEVEIPRLLKKNRFPNVNSAVDEITNIYIKILMKIKAKLPNVLIIVHSVIPSRIISSPIVYEFNRQLRLKTSENQIRFLDLFAKFGFTDVAVRNYSYSKYYALLRKWLISQQYEIPKRE